jgi:hypothetical protein
MIVARDDVCLLGGIVWRLPLSRNVVATPLLPVVAPRLDLVAAGIHPEGVAD